MNSTKTSFLQLVKFNFIRILAGLSIITVICALLFNAAHIFIGKTSTKDYFSQYSNEQEFRQRCSEIDATSNSAEHIVFYTVPRALSTRRQMQHDHAVANMSCGTRDFRCTAYHKVSQFVHLAAPKTKPSSVFIALTTIAYRILAEDSVFRTWALGSGVHILLTVPIDDSPDAERIATVELAKLGLASFHVQRAPTDFYGDAWSNSLPRMVQITKAQHVSISHYMLIDDDTMITSVTNLRHILDEHDPEIERVIGSPSEAIHQVQHSGAGQGGYGGAGIILTRALAENVAASWEQSAVLRYTHRAGDCMLSGAIAFVQGRPMRSPNIYYERALHQNDIHHPAISLFKAGFRWITIHHWNWFDIFPGISKSDQIRRVAKAFRLLDSENVFQNYLLRHDLTETVVLTNGYCVTRYSPPLSDLDLYLMEDSLEGDRGKWFTIDALEPTHGRYRAWREEGTNKTTWWLNSISQSIKEQISILCFIRLLRPGASVSTGSLDIKPR